MTEKNLNYQSSGVDYDLIDEMKRYAQKEAQKTNADSVFEKYNIREVEGSRGQSAYVTDVGPYYDALTLEGLGTKNLIADTIGTEQHTYYDAIAQDTVATITNDMITVGAQPLTVSPIWSFGSSDWFLHKKRWQDLVDGWVSACSKIGARYVAGETAVLTNMIYPEVAILTGAGRGIIDPKDRLTLGEKLQDGDHIILVQSNGIHTNGLSLARKIAAQYLPDGYDTMLPDGHSFGEALLKPSHLYSPLVAAVFDSGVDIHYMVHITGHGLSKIMRADQEFTYRIHSLPEVPPEFLLMQAVGNITPYDMYHTFNMGSGFAFMVNATDAQKVIDVATLSGVAAVDAGFVVSGPKQVEIVPQNIIFDQTSLQIK